MTQSTFCSSRTSIIGWYIVSHSKPEVRNVLIEWTRDWAVAKLFHNGSVFSSEEASLTRRQSFEGNLDHILHSLSLGNKRLSEKKKPRGFAQLATCLHVHLSEKKYFRGMEVRNFHLCSNWIWMSGSTRCTYSAPPPMWWMSFLTTASSYVCFSRSRGA